METGEPSQHSLVDTGKPRKTCDEVGRGIGFRYLITTSVLFLTSQPVASRINFFATDHEHPLPPSRVQLLSPAISSFHTNVSIKSSPVTGLEWPRGFQEVKVPRFHYSGTGWW